MIQEQLSETLKKGVIQLVFRRIGYYASEAIKSISYNWMMTVASIVTVTGCLLLFGIFLVFGVNLNYISDQVMQQCEMQAFIYKDASYDNLVSIKEQIEKVEGVRTVGVETQADAFKKCQELLGERAEGLDNGSFLRPSCIITLDDLSLAEQVSEKIATISGVEQVKTRQDIMDRVLSVATVIQYAGIGCMLLLAVIAVFIISNTIKLAVHAREREIHIMKYVGATDWFIRWPFIIEGIIVGLIGGVISLLVVSVGYQSISGVLTGFMDVFAIKSLSSLFGLLTVCLIVFGAFMGAVGSLLAVRKHLHV